jgi:hypothetical protein
LMPAAYSPTASAGAGELASESAQAASQPAPTDAPPLSAAVYWTLAAWPLGAAGWPSEI